MKAKNPNGPGEIDVHFPSGPGMYFYGKRCRDCDSSAGGGVAGPGLPEPRISERAVCPRCGGKNLEIVLPDGEPS